MSDPIIPAPEPSGIPVEFIGRPVIEANTSIPTPDALWMSCLDRAIAVADNQYGQYDVEWVIATANAFYDQLPWNRKP